MRKYRNCAWLIGCAGLVVSQIAQAGRPMTTDDAAITEAGQCQLQSWVQHDRSLDELWLLPACTPLTRMEITAGGALPWDERTSRDPLWSVQLKFLLRDQAPGAWGAAVSVGWNRRDSAAPEDRIDAQPLNFAASYRASDESFLVHINVGMRRDEVGNQTHATWGVAYERAPAARLGGFMEIFGASGESPTLQTGLRYDVVPQKVSVNFTLGATWRNGLHEPFATVGVNL